MTPRQDVARRDRHKKRCRECFRPTIAVKQTGHLAIRCLPEPRAPRAIAGYPLVGRGRWRLSTANRSRHGQGELATLPEAPLPTVAVVKSTPRFQSSRAKVETGG